MNVLLQTLGCRLNEAELQTWAQDFAAKGHKVTQDPSAADLIVVNTCAVTREAAKKSRQSIRKLHQASPTARVVVSGCYASLEEDKVKDLLGVDLVVDNERKDQLVDEVHEALDVDVPTMPAAALDEESASLFSRGRSRAFLKVQDGCRYNCTYCIVTVARGEERSKPIDALVDEVNQLHRDGILEVVLAGVHVGGYGSDLNTDLKTLVEALLERTTVPRIRFASVEPWDLPDDFFTLFKNPRLLPHMHLPLQSGHDKVLKRMARRCKTSDFKALVERARREVPGFNVTTDIIVGFPGETEEMFAETLAFVESVGFGHIHIFPFSPREGTHAAKLKQDVPGDVKKDRSKRLHALAAKLKQQALHEQLGGRDEVLVECIVDDAHGARWVGYSKNFTRVFIDVRDVDAAGLRLEEGAVVEVDVVANDASHSQGEQLRGLVSSTSSVTLPPRKKGALQVLAS